MKLSIGYPSLEEEREILWRRRERWRDDAVIEQVTSAEELLAMCDAEVYVDADIEEYIVRLVAATRSDARVAVGASPRGSLALLKLAWVRAALDERDFVIPDDVKVFVRPAPAHLSF
jgi:MoxR-like ATPase